MKEKPENILRTKAKALGIDLTQDMVSKLDIYMEMLKDWNTRMNLTAIEEDEDIIVKHFIDSMTIIPFIKETKENGSLIDVGTGAGFPGVVVKIICPEIRLTLLDSLEKRIRFLTAVSEAMGYNDICCVHGRAEDCGRDPDYREKFDFASARAVASMPVLIEYALPLVKTNGYFIAMKGNHTEEKSEYKKALEMLSGELYKEEVLFLPDTDMERHIFYVKKIRQVSTKFPRKSGVPSKTPLK